jgi:hypothetical protein
MLAVKECISGVASFYYATPPFMADEEQSAGFTYNEANQLTVMTISGIDIEIAYDARGRVASRSVELGEDTYTATYACRYGVGSGVRF